MDWTARSAFRSFLTAGIVVGMLYGAHLVYCQRSTLQLLDAAAVSSDMHGNLLWAKGIAEQGWLNPRPYHPWTDWMPSVAPYSQWVEWWGGQQVFQQSPLYAYLLSLFVHRYLSMRVLQAMISIATCAFIGLFTARIAGRTAGWTAFWLAALYAPFYLYSWPFLRDGLGWFLTSATLWALAELTAADWPSARASLLSWVVGVLLGCGFLAKENFQLLIPAALVALACYARRRGQWQYVASVALAAAVTITPLVLRNWMVDAPLLSSSNRFAETFIQGNAATASPYQLTVPAKMASILYESHGRPGPVIQATVASHPDGFRGWMWLQVRKLGSLLDPYESPDNLSFYFVAHISPLVRFGLRYWMILPPALGGLLLSVWRREKTHFWIWLVLPVSLVTLLVGVPLSRYRQSLAVVLIPLAGFFLASLYSWFRGRDYRKVSVAIISLLFGWGLILGPLARRPRAQYERVSEYLVSAEIYHQLGDQQKARATIDFIRQRFPGILQ